MKTKKKIKKAFDKWLKPLGLLWWTVKTVYYEDPNEIIQNFRDPGEGCSVAAKTYVNWKYADATIDINVPAFEHMSFNEVERIVVHECLHVLLNEMREDEMHHEERVVTGLTKAIFWIESMAKEEKTKVMTKK